MEGSQQWPQSTSSTTPIPIINGRLGAAITRRVGTMWAFYLAAVTMASWMVLAGFAWGPLHQIDPYPFAFLLFLGNIV